MFSDDPHIRILTNAIHIDSPSCSAKPVGLDDHVCPAIVVPDAMERFIWVFLLQSDGDDIHYLLSSDSCLSFLFSLTSLHYIIATCTKSVPIVAFLQVIQPSPPLA